MDNLERRALIGLAGVGALAAMAKAGPLDPPVGPLSPTGRTLDDIYNKVPATGAADGRIPLASTIISAPGSYVLTGNIASSGSAMTINADNVTLDLNGFTLSSTSTTLGVIV